MYALAERMAVRLRLRAYYVLLFARSKGQGGSMRPQFPCSFLPGSLDPVRSKGCESSSQDRERFRFPYAHASLDRCIAFERNGWGGDFSARIDKFRGIVKKRVAPAQIRLCKGGDGVTRRSWVGDAGAEHRMGPGREDEGPIVCLRSGTSRPRRAGLFFFIERL